MTDADLDLGKSLILHGAAVHKTADLIAATESATLTRSLSEASNLTWTVRDADKALWRSGILDSKSWATVDGLRYELSSFRRTGSNVELVFDDLVFSRMQSVTGYLKVAAGGSRSAFLQRLARDAKVPFAIDPGKGLGATKNDLERASKDDPTGESSWGASGRVAEEVGWRRFSDGRRMVAGSDAWLAARTPAVKVQDGVGAVDSIDCDVDLWQATSTASLTVWAERWALPPGTPVQVVNEGPASGLWLVESVSRSLTSRQASVDLTRRTKQLAEPAASDTGDGGDTASLPGEKGSDKGGKAYSGSAERMIAAGLAKVGKAQYVYGAHGPNAYDCSGFVSYCIKAGGGSTTGTAATLLAACQSHHTTISVADGIATRGALLFNIGGGGGASGNHVGFSLGNGQSLEARSPADDIDVFDNAAGRGWNYAALIPGF